MNKINILSEEGEKVDYFEQVMLDYFQEQHDKLQDDFNAAMVTNWSMQNQDWRKFYSIFHMLTPKHLQMTFIGKIKKVQKNEAKEGEEAEIIETEEEKEVDVFDVVYKVLNLVLELGQSSNLSVKKTVLYKMFPLFVNNALSFCGRKHSNAYLTMLKNAHAI
jgi:hypothetical protein